MSLFTIDRKKCKRDGMCAKECPAQIIILAGKDAFPTLMENGEESCIQLWSLCSRLSPRRFNSSTMPLAECPSIQP